MEKAGFLTIDIPYYVNYVNYESSESVNKNKLCAKLSPEK